MPLTPATIRIGSVSHPVPRRPITGWVFRGGLSTKIHLACEQGHKPLSGVLTAGHAGDSPQFATVLDAIRLIRTGPGRPRTRPGRVLADKAYSSRAARSRPADMVALREYTRWAQLAWTFVTHGDLRNDVRAARLTGDVKARREAQDLIHADARAGPRRGTPLDRGGIVPGRQGPGGARRAPSPPLDLLAALDPA